MSFDAQLRSTLSSIHAKPTAAEAVAVIDVARLAAAADNKTDVSEMVVLLALTRVVCDLAGVGDIPAVKPVDAERLAEIGDLLVPQGARELAFASAFLIMVQDLEVTAEEKRLADALGQALVIDDARAKQLADTMESLVRAGRSTAS